MQKLEILVWNGKQYSLMAHDYLLDSLNVNHALVQVFLKPPEKKEEKPEKKPESK